MFFTSDEDPWYDYHTNYHRWCAIRWCHTDDIAPQPPCPGDPVLNCSSCWSGVCCRLSPVQLALQEKEVVNNGHDTQPVSSYLELEPTHLANLLPV